MNIVRLGSALIASIGLACATGWADEPAPDKHGTEATQKSKRKHYFNSYLHKRPIELETEANHWVNGDEKLSLQKLHGKVVWLEFNF